MLCDEVMRLLSSETLSLYKSFTYFLTYTKLLIVIKFGGLLSIDYTFTGCTIYTTLTAFFI